MSRARCGCSNARARAGVEKFVYAASSSCYGLADTPTREDHPIDPQYPYALSQISGRTGGVPLAQGLSACRSIRSASSTPMARACAPPAPMARSSAYFSIRSSPASRSRWSATARSGAIFSMSPTSREAFLAAAETELVGEVWNLGAGDPQSVNRLGRAARAASRSTSPSGRASRTAPAPTSPRSPASSAGSRQFPSRKASSACWRNRAWRDAPLVGSANRSPRRRRPGSNISGQRRG